MTNIQNTGNTFNPRQYNIKGYIIIFNSVDSYRDLFTKETIVKLKSERLPLLYEHNFEEQLGWIKNVDVDLRGIYINGIILEKCPECARYDLNLKNSFKNIVDKISKGDLTGLSIGYTKDDQVQVIDQNKNFILNIINQATLWEISIVQSPAENNAKLNHFNSSDFNT